ncbi:MAG TPA: hypothetical protein VLE43_00295, partial [Candidatus Saccharimonadia bacterium]|nr:hypothetical protein [Candidatus Saccharimonadia bacterium]
NPFEKMFREKPLPSNFILWGHTSNGALLASMKLDSRIEWVVAVIANNYADSLCHFMSATQFLHSYLTGTLNGNGLCEWRGATSFVKQ